MRLDEFTKEIAEVFKVYEKEPSQAYLSNVFEIVSEITVDEFIKIKKELIQTCDYFPKPAKWKSLISWGTSYRLLQLSLCKMCSGSGKFRAQCIGEGFTPEWEMSLTHDEKLYIKQRGRTTIGLNFIFRCPCIHGENHPQLTTWQDYHSDNFQIKPEGAA